MYELERIAAVLKPTQRFLDWIQQLPGDEMDELELSDLREDCTTLLIPAFDSPDEADAYIKEMYADIFANELESWDTDPESWPDEPSFDMFSEWFDIEYHSMVFDTVEDEDDLEEGVEFDEDADDDEEYEEYELAEDEDEEEYEDEDDDEDEDEYEYEEEDDTK